MLQYQWVGAPRVQSTGITTVITINDVTHLHNMFLLIVFAHDVACAVCTVSTPPPHANTH